MHNYIIGVDGGGSKTHAILVNNNQIIDEVYSGPANIRTNIDTAYQSISDVISQLIQKYNLSLDDTPIGIGVAGYSMIVNRENLFNLLVKRFPQVKLESDCHIACLAAHNGHDGSVVICGTGIVGYYIEHNIGHQIGGWGFPHGDLGGGAWIGLELCRYTCKAIDEIIDWDPLLTTTFNNFQNSTKNFKMWLLQATPGDFASITKLLLQYNHENCYYNKIINSATNEVRMFINAVIHQAPNSPLKITGGLAPIFLPQLKKHFSELELSENTPAFGACLLTF